MRIEPGVMQGIWQSIIWIDSKESGDSQKWIDSEIIWKNQLFRYENAGRFQVQMWTAEYCHINKWKPFLFPLISPPQKVSSSFHFYESKEGIKHSLKLIKWQVHSHIFHEPEKGGVHSQIGPFIVLFYKSDERKIICSFMFREFEMNKKTPKAPFS